MGLRNLGAWYAPGGGQSQNWSLAAGLADIEGFLMFCILLRRNAMLKSPGKLQNNRMTLALLPHQFFENNIPKCRAIMLLSEQ